MNIWEYMTSCNMKAFKFPTDMFVGSTLYPWVSLLENKLGILCLLFRRWDLAPQTEGMCRLQICETRHWSTNYNGCEGGGKWARGQTCKESWAIFVNEDSVNGWLHDSLWKRGSTSLFCNSWRHQITLQRTHAQIHQSILDCICTNTSWAFWPSEEGI